MPISDEYRRQVSLLVQMLPFVSEEKCFALKGGTAINLFIRNLPRLSVDVDLMYLPIHDRLESLKEIDASLKRIASTISRGIPNADVRTSQLNTEGTVNKLIVQTRSSQVKIEVTPVLRGCVYEPEQRRVTDAVEAEYGFARAQVVSFADLYAGKIVAALDRQHPRDLFDVRDLLANEGIGEDLRTAFVVYLLSHGRPMHEVLDPRRLDIAQEYERGFDGMTAEPVDLKDLLNTREQMIETMTREMPNEHRQLLVGFISGEPDWSLLGVEGVKNLPAIRWRALNLDKLDKKRRADLANQIGALLDC